MDFVSHSVALSISRVRTITVDVTRGGDYALWDYARQKDRFGPLFAMLQEVRRQLLMDLWTDVWRSE